MKIFDSSSIISIFKEAKYPKILINCTNRKYILVVPETVYNELKRNKRTYDLFLKYKELFEIKKVDRNCFDIISARYPYFHEGEIGVICRALEEKKSGNRHICILDEKKARNFCKKENIRVAGLISLLKWQKSIGDLSPLECKIIYKNLYSSRFYIKKNILNELIE